jgi:phospholipid transport system substrate-binding protein
MFFRIAYVALVSIVLLCGSARAESDPRAAIQELSDRLIDVMKHGPALGFNGRKEKLQPVIASVYDMVAMTRTTLGVAGGKLSPEDAQKVADAYTRFSVATYADQFAAWNGERFEVDQPRAAANGMMLVPTRLIPGSGDPISIDYLMKEDEGNWRIVDVLFDGAISQVALRRSELLPVFRREGVDGLVTALDTKSQAMAGK